jgi:PPM family protein phosphatase
MAELRWGATTDPGRVRDENEDSFVTEPMVFVVADGMGGHQAGEVASALAASTLRERLQGGASSVDVVVAAVLEANAAIFHSAHNNVAQRGMGTTLTALAVLPANDERGELLALVNVGDSRMYLLRGGQLTRATVDHSYVQELLATGHITEAEARSHPRRNIVTRALGIEPTVRVDSWLLPIVRGDRFVLCSDGLVDEVDDEDIDSLLQVNEDPQAAAEALTAAAVTSGGRDNVTVIVIDVLEGMDPADLEALVDTGGDALLQVESQPMEIDADPDTEQVPVIEPRAESSMKRQLSRQVTAGRFLFFLLAAVVLTVIVTLIAVAVSNTTDDPPPTTTTSTTSTTSTTTSTSTTTTTSTTVAPSTTVRSVASTSVAPSTPTP